MGNPTLREGMQSADGWVEYLHELLNDHFRSHQTMKFYDTGGTFDATTKAAVEQYQRDMGFTGRDVDGVVGDKTWSALQAHETLAPTGTDGYEPGTYVDHGKHLRFDANAAGYGNGINNLTLKPKKAVIYGTNSLTAPDMNTATAFYGAIYTPTGDFKVVSNNSIYGSIVARNVTFTGAAPVVHYDMDLRNTILAGVDTPFAVSDWRESSAAN